MRTEQWLAATVKPEVARIKSECYTRFHSRNSAVQFAPVVAHTRGGDEKLKKERISHLLWPDLKFTARNIFVFRPDLLVVCGGYVVYSSRSSLLRAFSSFLWLLVCGCCCFMFSI
jgi:hypothetical protein